MNMPPTLYKYTSYEAAEAIITNRLLRFSAATDFNDPFDILIEEAIGDEIEDFLPQLTKAFFEMSVAKLDYSALRPSYISQLLVCINLGAKNMRQNSWKGSGKKS
jgi:hypothetical protein